MGSIQDLNEKRKKDQQAKEMRIRQTPFLSLNREDALIRMSYFQKDIEGLFQQFNEFRKEVRSLSKTLSSHTANLNALSEHFSLNEGFDNVLEKHLVLETGERKLRADEPVKMYDIVTVNFSGFRDGVIQSNMSVRNKTFDLSFQTFIPSLEEGLIGMKIGEKKVHPVLFPENYHVGELSGKSCDFELEVLDARRNVRLEASYAEQTERINLMNELKNMQIEFPAEKLQSMPIEQFRVEVEQLKKEFLNKNNEDRVYSTVPPADGQGTVTTLPDVVV